MTVRSIKREVVQATRNTKAAIDLASVMVGVLVIGIIGGIVAASIFAVIPWAQDNAAKASLGSVGIAQSAYSARAGAYTTYPKLVENKLVTESQKAYSFTDSTQQCYIAIVESDSGRKFYTTSKTTTPAEYTSTVGTDNGCYQMGNFSEEAGAVNPASATPANATRVYFSQISAGNEHSVALDLEGNVWSWGASGNGQLGLTTKSNVNRPTKTTSGTRYVQVEAGWNNTIALDSNGKIWSWGANANGELGNGTFTESSTPTMITPSKTYTSIKAGNGQTNAAIDTDGKLWVWGFNGNGQIGDGTTVKKNTPTNITPAKNYKTVALGVDVTQAIDTDGKIWGWGANYSGQVGDGTYVNRLTPVAGNSNQTFTTVSAGGEHVLALDNSGKLYVWGGDPSGQLGNGVGQQNSPNITMITPNQTYTQITTGRSHSAALDTDRKLWIWGKNQEGQQGNGTSGPDSSNKVEVPTLFNNGTKYTKIDAGYNHNITVDGTNNVYTWGYNINSQLGTGDNINKLTIQTVFTPAP